MEEPMTEATRDLPGEDVPATEIASRADAAMALMRADMMSDEDIRRSWRIATALAQSGMFKIEKDRGVTPEQAFAKMLIGRDLGITPTQALMTIDLVRGNVQMRAVLLASFVRKSDDYDYKVGEHTAEACEIQFTYRGQEAGVSRFTMADADTAGLTKPSRGGEPSMYQKHPKNMLWARAMSNGVKWYCPDLTGGIPVYTEADVFEGTATPMLDEGRGDGTGPGWGDMDPELLKCVRAVIDIAERRGHAGYSDVDTIQMALNGQDDVTIFEWIRTAMAELDAMAPTDAEVEAAVDVEGATDIDREALDAKRGELLDMISYGDQVNAPEKTLEALRSELAAIEAQLGPDEQIPGQEGLPL